MKITDLTPTEEDIMKSVWYLKRGYLREIIDVLPEPKPHQNTVSTYLKILAEKKFLSTKKEGRILIYETLIPFENYQNFKLKNFLDNYFDGRPIDLVQRLFQLNSLTPQDLNEFFDIKTTAIPKVKKKKKKKSPLRDFVDELTKKKKKKKKKK